MIELIFVIVILGIVASIGSEIIAKVYSQYIIQRAVHRASIKTELAALQIANRLHYAITHTTYRIKDDHTKETVESALTDITGDHYIGLQWVGYDMDSFNAISSNSNRKPGWSGFCDTNASTKNAIKTPGSKLSLADTIIQNLSQNSSGTATSSLSDAAIYFPYDTTTYNVSGRTGEDIITLDNNAFTIAEQYRLAWTSYALQVDNGDLYLYYRFSPSPATALGTTKKLLLKNVTTFKFKGTSTTLRFKLCTEEDIGADFNITSCKEKAVF